MKKPAESRAHTGRRNHYTMAPNHQSKGKQQMPAAITRTANTYLLRTGQKQTAHCTHQSNTFSHSWPQQHSEPKGEGNNWSPKPILQATGSKDARQGQSPKGEPALYWLYRSSAGGQHITRAALKTLFGTISHNLPLIWSSQTKQSQNKQKSGSISP